MAGDVSGGRHTDASGRGILMVIASTVFLAISDTTAKVLAGSLHPVEIAWLRFAGFALIMLAAAARSGRRDVLATPRPGLQVLRGLAVVGSAGLFISSLAFLPVAESTAISFVAPLFVTALSVLVLSERVGWRRWTATAVGFGGVLVIIRPGSAAFQPASLLPVLSALCWAGALVSTRRLAATDRADTTMTYSALVGLAALSLLLPWFWRWPTGTELLLGAAVGVLSTTGQWIVTAAYRHADASVLAPYSYSQIIWATLAGFALFGAVPDAWTFTGVGVIVASGLYTAHRQRVRAREG